MSHIVPMLGLLHLIIRFRHRRAGESTRGDEGRSSNTHSCLDDPVFLSPTLGMPPRTSNKISSARPRTGNVLLTVWNAHGDAKGTLFVLSFSLPSFSWVYAAPRWWTVWIAGDGSWCGWLRHDRAQGSSSLFPAKIFLFVDPCVSALVLRRYPLLLTFISSPLFFAKLFQVLHLLLPHGRLCALGE